MPAAHGQQQTTAASDGLALSPALSLALDQMLDQPPAPERPPAGGVTDPLADSTSDLAPLALTPAVAAAPLDPGASPVAATGDGEALDCVLRPSATVRLGGPVQGILAELLVDRGDRVTRGQLLARQDDIVEAATVAINRLRADSDAGVRSREAEAAFAASRAAKARTLRSRGVMPETEAEELLANEQVAIQMAAQAREDQALAALELARSQALLEQRSIESPIDGVVLERVMQPGEFVDADNHILVLAQLDPIHVETYAPAALFGRLQAGDRAEVVPAPPCAAAGVPWSTWSTRCSTPPAACSGCAWRCPTPTCRCRPGIAARSASPASAASAQAT